MTYNCGNCRFFKLNDPLHTYGDCHRSPPQFNFSANVREYGGYMPKQYKIEITRFRDGVFPNINQDDWCGEHQPVKKEEDVK